MSGNETNWNVNSEETKPWEANLIVNKRGNLIGESRLSNQNNRFYCSFCSYVTNHKWDFEKHWRIHTGEKPYQCDVCSYCASDPSSLRRHKFLHTGQKPFKCNYCDYSAARKYSLMSHVLYNHPSEAK